jgi:hypothetical protein
MFWFGLLGKAKKDPNLVLEPLETWTHSRDRDTASRPEPRRSAAEQQRHMAVLARPKMPKTDWMEEMESTEGTGDGKNVGFWHVWPTNCRGSARFTEHGLGLGGGYFVERCEELRDGLDVFICLEDLTWRTWDG